MFGLWFWVFYHLIVLNRRQIVMPLRHNDLSPTQYHNIITANRHYHPHQREEIMRLRCRALQKEHICPFPISTFFQTRISCCPFSLFPFLGQSWWRSCAHCSVSCTMQWMSSWNNNDNSSLMEWPGLDPPRRNLHINMILVNIHTIIVTMVKVRYHLIQFHICICIDMFLSICMIYYTRVVILIVMMARDSIFSCVLFHLYLYFTYLSNLIFVKLILSGFGILMS